MQEETKTLSITQKLESRTLYVTLKGWLDPNTSPTLTSELNLTDIDHLEIDMAQVEYVFSAGLRAFLQLKRTLDINGADMVLKNTSPSIRSIFEYTGLESMLDKDK